LALGGGGWIFHQSDRKAKPRPRKITVPRTPEAIDRGRYVARVNCELCHGHDLAGGREFTLPVVHDWASNITPDRASGIGEWSEGQIEEALRRGVAPDGRVLRPPMPRLDKLSDQDLEAL